MEWLYGIYAILAFICIIIATVTTLWSIPIFRAKGKVFKIVITLITINFSAISVIIVPLAKIASIIEEKHKKKKEIEIAISTGSNIELVYCPECGKAYAKGEEPCMCKCGYIFSRPQNK
ncbi:MAG: hypothetical protein ACI4JV_05155 [Ruminiclostridium sp.]